MAKRRPGELHLKGLNSDVGNEVCDESLGDTEQSNEELNSPFSESEVQKAISKLKTNKACGQDHILNEFIKHSCPAMLPLYVKLFNLVLESGIMPSDWAAGYIIPLYKKKGSTEDVDNYRGITILSCLGKTFTAVLNDRLNLFLSEYNSIGPEQAGFKAGHSTMDHAFVLKSLINLYLRKKKRLYCCFIDYKKAFDSVPRLELWKKLLAVGIDGKIFQLIKNMYSRAKSCVALNGCLSEYFPCQVGVRQGENLSPLLFSIYLADLESYLSENYEGLLDISSLATEFLGNGTLDVYLKLFILLYADDTILMAESPASLQSALDAMAGYCDKWKLCINTSKTKVVIFSRGKVRNIPNFVFNGTRLDVVDEYLYLGVMFNYNGKFTKAKNHSCQQASKAMFALLKRCRQLHLPLDIQLQLFDSLVAPILLYGSEIHANEGCIIIEKLHLRFCKYLLNVNKSTTSNMVYGELGRMPLQVQASVRALAFWFRLLYGEQTKLSCMLYRLLYVLDANGVYTDPWLAFVRNTLNDLGYGEFWMNQTVTGSYEWFKVIVKLRLGDQFKQKWAQEVHESGKCVNYRIFKVDFGLEPYLLQLSPLLRKFMSKFRCRNHRLPVESARNVDRLSRVCTLCNIGDVGDEFHYVLKCPAFLDDRKILLRCNMYSRPSAFSFHKLFNSNGPELHKLARFVKVIMTRVT